MNYDEVLNKRVVELPRSGIRKFFDLASEMTDCISLGVGEPDFVTPWDIRDGAIKAIQAGKTQYTSNAGLMELRTLVSKYLSERYGLCYAPENEIIITVGASEAIDLALRTIVEPGDEVLVPAPSYVSYQPNVQLVYGTPVPLPLSEQNGFKLTPEIIKGAITDKTKAIIVPYPNNPTGAIMTREELEKIRQVIIDNNLIVISDEIYSELTYGRKHCSIASLEGMRERTIVINGFSKAFAMTGWRQGYICAPKEIIDNCYKIHQYTIMCAPTFSQYASIRALKTGFEEEFETVEKMRESYDMRRRYLVNALNSMGMDCFEPNGAFYVFPSVKRFGLTGEQFAERLLMEKKVAVVPGSAFGAGGEFFVRCSYATGIKQLQIACERIKSFISDL